MVFLKTWFLMNWKKGLTIYVTSRLKKLDFCLSCHPSTNILPRSHLGLVRRLEDPMDLPLWTWILAVVVWTMDFLLCLLNLTLKVQKGSKRMWGSWSMFGLRPSWPQTSLKGLCTVVMDQALSSFVPGLTTDCWYFPNVNLKKKKIHSPLKF